MAQIKSRDTKPEISVRRAAHAAGLRFKLHQKNLPGTPDIVLSKCRVAVFVHGCFWHRHENCKNCTTPKSRSEFWQSKFSTNLRRDARAREELELLGWAHFIVWECEAEAEKRLSARISELWQLCHDRSKYSISSN